MDVNIDSRVWNLGDSIGSGGFGRVYLAKAGNDEAVIKLVPKDPGAQRELLLVGDLSGVPNVVPVLGVADAGDHWAILMERAEQSLRDLLNTVREPLDRVLALPILLDIAQALVTLQQNRVVHRDVKPDNILLFKNHWCLTDFGISRYAAATTAADTRKYMMTSAYAAPEQWREEQATSATDIYAFGITAYELLAGKRPFNGPDYRSQHLHDTPSILVSMVEAPLSSIIDECLIKAPQARPTPARLLDRLQTQIKGAAPTGGAAALYTAHRLAIHRISEEAREASAAQTESRRRAELFDAARQTFVRLKRQLMSVIRENAPSTTERELPVRLGYAQLQLPDPTTNNSVGIKAFDVIAHTEVRIDQASAPGRIYVGRSHSLWYCDAQHEGEYAWYETAFMDNPAFEPQTGFNIRRQINPFSSTPRDDAAQQALRVGSGTYQIAWPFTPIRDDSIDEFIDRWVTWLAEASTGQLKPPRRLPERRVQDTWRK